eukprot:gene9705-3680_t
MDDSQRRRTSMLASRDEKDLASRLSIVAAEAQRLVAEKYGSNYTVLQDDVDVSFSQRRAGASSVDPVTLPPEYARAEQELQDAQRLVNEKRKQVQAQRQGAAAERSQYVAEQIEYERNRIPLLEQEVAKAKEEVQAQTTEAAKMAEETIMLRLQDDVQAAAYHELRVERMRQALSKLDAQADMKQAEISAAEELVDENEASVVGNLLPHLKNKALEAELRKVYGEEGVAKMDHIGGRMFRPQSPSKLTMIGGDHNTKLAEMIVPAERAKAAIAEQTAALDSGGGKGCTTPTTDASVKAATGGHSYLRLIPDRVWANIQEQVWRREKAEIEAAQDRIASSRIALIIYYEISNDVVEFSRSKLGNKMPGDSLELLLTRLHGDAQLSRSKQKEFAVKHKQPLKSIAPKIISYKGVKPGHASSTAAKRKPSKREVPMSKAATKKKKKRSSMTAVQLAIEQAANAEEVFEDPDVVKIQAPTKQRTTMHHPTALPSSSGVADDSSDDGAGGAAADKVPEEEQEEVLSPDMQLVCTAVYRGSYDFLIGSSSGDLMLYHSHDADTREY